MENVLLSLSVFSSVSDPGVQTNNSLQCVTCDNDAVCNKTVQCVGVQSRCFKGYGEPFTGVTSAFKCSLMDLIYSFVKQWFCHPQWKLITTPSRFLAVLLQTCVLFSWTRHLLWLVILTLPEDQNVVEPASVIQPGRSIWVLLPCFLFFFSLSSIRTKSEIELKGTLKNLQPTTNNVIDLKGVDSKIWIYNATQTPTSECPNECIHMISSNFSSFESCLLKNDQHPAVLLLGVYSSCCCPALSIKTNVVAEKLLIKLIINIFLLFLLLDSGVLWSLRITCLFYVYFIWSDKCLLEIKTSFINEKNTFTRMNEW